MQPNQITEAIIGCALRVHTALGPGMLEKTMELCLLQELMEIGMQVEHQVYLPVVYKQARIPLAYRVDLIVENCVLVEVKCVEQLLPVHAAQLLPT
jgi:GxxExxY protein